MEDSYEELQTRSVQSVSGIVDDTYEQIELSVHPTRSRQMQYATTTTVKVILGLLGVVVLVALVVAVVAVVLNLQHISKLDKKISRLEQMAHKTQADQTKLTDSELPQSSPTGTSSSTSPATLVPTAPKPVTPVPTASTPATPVFPKGSLTYCASIHSSYPSATSGVYTIHIGGRVQGRAVWCDMVTAGGGWTMFQRRQDGTVEFNRTWSQYKSGFGSAAAEIWLGNDDLYTLTSAQPSELRVDLYDWEGNHTNATYSSFSIGSESTNYTLHVSGYRGTAGDALTYHDSQMFSTKYRDNDGKSGRNCATIYGGDGGWWYDTCYKANLNGRYYPNGVNVFNHGVHWNDWLGGNYSIKAASMMTRPRDL